jgi:hypothetical protein
VTLDGQPLQGAAISFVPTDPAHRRAMGFIGADGTYSIKEGQGPNVGRYKVVLNWPEPPPSPESPPGPERLPARYNTKTTLEVEIVPDSNTHDFALTKG